MPQFTVYTGTSLPLRRSDVDTDQIIPARFCTNPTRNGFADALFADWRADPGFVLNQSRHRDATILVAGHNFGVGSSREAAVWALHNFGFRAVIAPRYGDIFRTNALMNGLLAVTVPMAVVERMWALADREPATRITVDLEQLEVRGPDIQQSFTLDAHIQEQLLSGMDHIGATLRYEPEIAAYERRRRSNPVTSIPACKPGAPRRIQLR